MFKPSDRLPGGSALPLGRLVLVVASLAPVIALAGVATLDPTPKAQAAPHPPTLVQIRCWQDGRLLFEENGVHLPDGAQYGTLVSGTDRQGRPVYLAETRNATCLIRQALPERAAWPR